MLRAVLRQSYRAAQSVGRRYFARITSTPTVLPFRTFSPAVYTDPKQLDAEYERIFKKEWQVIGATSGLREPGNYISFKVAGKFPVFVIRDSDGSLKGFHNVCRHRGSPMVTEPCGKLSVLRCPYHSWTYDRNGKLRKCPGFQTDIDKSQFSLFDIRVEEWRGLVWVNLSTEGPSLIESLGGYPEESASFDWNSFEVMSTQDVELACNWKTWAENYNDKHHVAAIHPSMSKLIDCNTYDILHRDNGRYMLHIAESTDKMVDGHLWAFIYPNTIIHLAPEGMDIECILPMGPSRTLLKWTYFAKKGCEEIMEEVRKEAMQIAKEDISIVNPLCENLHAGFYDTSVLCGGHENGLVALHRYYRQSMGMAPVEAGL